MKQLTFGQFIIKSFKEERIWEPADVLYQLFSVEELSEILPDELKTGIHVEDGSISDSLIASAIRDDYIKRYQNQQSTKDYDSIFNYQLEYRYDSYAKRPATYHFHRPRPNCVRFDYFN